MNIAILKINGNMHIEGLDSLNEWYYCSLGFLQMLRCMSNGNAFKW